jgi:putative hydrolase of the HAD superfamily
VFDLDETLYRERQFVLSGFRAVARAVEARFGVAADEANAILRRELAQGRRQTAFQTLVINLGLPRGTVAELVTVFRSHRPRLRLPRPSAQVLAELRSRWAVGILTNGLPAVQAGKIAALGLADKVDAVVYASETGPGKPDARAFEVVLGRLGTQPRETVFVGDDLWRDIAGARRVGLKTIRVDRRVARSGPTQVRDEADAVVHSILEVPRTAVELFSQGQRHVA